MTPQHCLFNMLPTNMLNKAKRKHGMKPLAEFYIHMYKYYLHSKPCARLGRTSMKTELRQKCVRAIVTRKVRANIDEKRTTIEMCVHDCQGLRFGFPFCRHSCLYTRWSSSKVQSSKLRPLFPPGHLLFEACPVYNRHFSFNALWYLIPPLQVHFQTPSCVLDSSSFCCARFTFFLQTLHING